jgi:hypothetical protein
MVAPSRVPMVNAPFIMNFMLLVPLASKPAVEMALRLALPLRKADFPLGRASKGATPRSLVRRQNGLRESDRAGHSP